MLDLMVSADVAELADAQVSEACGVTPVEVRVLSSAPKISVVISAQSNIRPAEKADSSLR